MCMHAGACHITCSLKRHQYTNLLMKMQYVCLFLKFLLVVLVQNNEYHVPRSPFVKYCLGLTPAGNSAPHSRLLTPPQRGGGENWKGKSEKTRGLR